MADGMIGGGKLVVGGLGEPYDALVAAALSPERDVVTLGALDAEAMARGRAALPRGQCAPLLATTGALLARANAFGTSPGTFLGVSSCGPCRYSLFGASWRRALGPATRHRVVTLGQSLSALQAALGADAAERVLDALLAADALVQAKWRLWPHVGDSARWLSQLEQAVAEVVARTRAGVPPLDALSAAREAVSPRVVEAGAVRPRVAVIGEPWSLHVDGDAQGGVLRVLCEAGVEVDAPPLALWLAYRLWEQDPAAEARWLTERHERACAALGQRAVPWPSMNELAELAAPYLPSSFRGGYGHVEVGLAARVRARSSADGVVSLKSFGCIPSAGVSDGIVPAVLGSDVDFLSLEISEDGVAARESRLMLLIASVQERARRRAARRAEELP